MCDAREHRRGGPALCRDILHITRGTCARSMPLLPVRQRFGHVVIHTKCRGTSLRETGPHPLEMRPVFSVTCYRC